MYVKIFHESVYLVYDISDTILDFILNNNTVGKKSLDKIQSKSGYCIWFLTKLLFSFTLLTWYIGLAESMWNSVSMTSSMMLAQEFLKQEPSVGEQRAVESQPFEGPELLAQTIDSGKVAVWCCLMLEFSLSLGHIYGGVPLAKVLLHRLCHK